MNTGLRALLIVHLQSLDSYCDYSGSDEAEEKAAMFIDAIRQAAEAERPIFVFGKRWPITDRTMRPREDVQEALDDTASYVWITHDEGEEPWEPSLSFLVGSLRLAGVKVIDLVGGWYDPKSLVFGGEDSGCMLYVEDHLRELGFITNVLVALSLGPETP